MPLEPCGGVIWLEKRASAVPWVGITLASVLGATIYGFTLLLLRAFDRKELALAKHLIQSMLPHR